MASSPFDLLPDELVMKIIKMAKEGVPDSDTKHVFLLDTIAKISTRFKRISVDASLWRDQVVVMESEEDAILGFGQSPVTKLVIKGGPDVILIPGNLTSIYPNLEELTVHIFGYLDEEAIKTYTVSGGDCPFLSKDSNVATTFAILKRTWERGKIYYHIKKVEL